MLAHQHCSKTEHMCMLLWPCSCLQSSLRPLAGTSCAAKFPGLICCLLTGNVWAADKKLDVAATVLRMLFIKDLRVLQSSVDESIVAIQVRK